MNHHSSVERSLDDIRTGEGLLPWDEPIGNLLTGWAVSRHRDGASSVRALVRNCRNLRLRCKGRRPRETLSRSEYQGAARGRTDP